MARKSDFLAHEMSGYFSLFIIVKKRPSFLSGCTLISEGMKAQVASQSSFMVMQSTRSSDPSAQPKTTRLACSAAWQVNGATRAIFCGIFRLSWRSPSTGWMKVLSRSTSVCC